MRFKIPKNTDSPRYSFGGAGKISWTNHSIDKMRYYQLSEARLKRVLNNPKRKEIGIAPGTVAVMQPASVRLRRTSAGKPTEDWKSEIWVMYQNIKSKVKGQKLKVITAWRYPGKSPVRGPIPIPQEILEELGEIN